MTRSAYQAEESGFRGFSRKSYDSRSPAAGAYHWVGRNSERLELNQMSDHFVGFVELQTVLQKVALVLSSFDLMRDDPLQSVASSIDNHVQPGSCGTV
jgi:hypothetical protein